MKAWSIHTRPRRKDIREYLREATPAAHQPGKELLKQNNHF